MESCFRNIEGLTANAVSIAEANIDTGDREPDYRGTAFEWRLATWKPANPPRMELLMSNQFPPAVLAALEIGAAYTLRLQKRSVRGDVTWHGRGLTFNGLRKGDRRMPNPRDALLFSGTEAGQVYSQ